MHTVPFTAEQLRWVLAAFALLGALPAAAVARHARRRGDRWAWWAGLVLFTSVIGIVAYWEHVAIQRKRAKRRARAAAAEADATEGAAPAEAGGEET